MKTTYPDESHWSELARAHGLNLPQKTTPCTTQGMEQWLRKLDLTIVWFYEWSGFRCLNDWRVANPTWSLRAFAGLLLEEAASLPPEPTPAAPMRTADV